MEETTKTQTQEQTPQHQMTTMRTSHPSPVNKPQTSRPQTFDRCSRVPLGAVCSLMYQHFLALEALFEDHGVCSGAVTDSLVLERAVYEQRALVQPLPTALQLVDRQKKNTCYSISPSPVPSQFTLVNLHDLLALAAAVYLYIKLHLSTQQRYPHSLPELFTAFTAPLVRRHSGDVPRLHSASTVQRVVHAEFRMPQQQLEP